MNLDKQEYSYPHYARIMHMGMAIFGILAYLTAEGADDGVASSAYLLHAYLGLSLATFMLLRVLGGLVGTGPLRFIGWSPFAIRQWKLAWQDIKSILQFKIENRRMHEGIAGITQAFGLTLFAWMGGTGTMLYLIGGSPESDIFEMIEEAHEVGETLIPLYLALHIGSVIVHSLLGHSIWRRMWKIRDQTPTTRTDSNR